jgi:short-subunit dehydrogenase
LKEKYKCDWALVTGAGSGIGKSLAETLALQGLNVVLVSLPMKDLDETFDTLKSQFPKQEFRKYVIGRKEGKIELYIWYLVRFWSRSI